MEASSSPTEAKLADSAAAAVDVIGEMRQAVREAVTRGSRYSYSISVGHIVPPATTGPYSSKKNEWVNQVFFRHTIASE